MADLMHDIRVPRTNGVLRGTVRHSLRQKLEQAARRPSSSCVFGPVSAATITYQPLTGEYHQDTYLYNINHSTTKRTTRKTSQIKIIALTDLPSQRLSTPVTGTPQGGMFSPTLSVEEDGFKQQMDHQTIQRVNNIKFQATS